MEEEKKCVTVIIKGKMGGGRGGHLEMMDGGYLVGGPGRENYRRVGRKVDCVRN